jgi:hypothetical protein
MCTLIPGSAYVISRGTRNSSLCMCTNSLVLSIAIISYGCFKNSQGVRKDLLWTDGPADHKKSIIFT